MIARDWLRLDQEPWRDREELCRALAAERERSASLCAWANRLEVRVLELSRGRRVVAARDALFAELPLLPTLEQKRAAAARHGVTLRQVNRLLRERGGPQRLRLKGITLQQANQMLREAVRQRLKNSRDI